MSYLYFGIPIVFLLFITILVIVFHCRKKYAIRKVCSMCPEEKKELLDTMAGPLGYCYDPCQDIFISTVDAPQKIFGYTTFYDLSAPYFNMVFDYETFYFDYRGRTWLIEIWKGQYGINTGCEIGVYYADEIIPPEKYGVTVFKAVSEQDMLEFGMKLNRRCKAKHCRKDCEPDKISCSGDCRCGRQKNAGSAVCRCGQQTDADGRSCCYCQLGRVQARHWWLAIFRMGCYTKPKDLFVNTAISFPDQRMMRSFLESFRRTMPDTACKVSGCTIYFTFDESRRRYSWFRRLVRRLALCSCRFYCRWFNFLTRPFQCSGDKLIYAYYYLPFIVRRMFRPKRKRKHCGKNCRRNRMRR